MADAAGPYGDTHGGNVVGLARNLGADASRVLDFSSNANCLAEPLTRRVVESLDYPFGHYPDPECGQLRRALAEHEGLGPERIMAGNGSSELIFLALSALSPRSALIAAPLFSEYARACQGLDIPHGLHTLNPDADFRAGTEDLDRLADWDGDLLVACTPNNPTGASLDLERLLPRLRCKRLLLDLTYREFLFGAPAHGLHSHARLERLLPPGVGLVTLHSFTKFFHCTGIRLGWCVSDPDALALMERRRAPWMVSRHAELAGMAMLERLDEYRATLPGLWKLKARMARLMEECGVFDRVAAGDLNFLACKARPPATAAGLAASLAKAGLLARCCDTIPGMPPGWLRLSVRPEAEQDALARAIRNLTEDTSHA